MGAGAVELIAKFAALLGAGAILLAVNFWYAKALYNNFRDGGVVIAPVKIYGKDQKLVGLEENLSQLLLSKILEIEWKLEQSQTQLQTTTQPNLANSPQSQSTSTAGDTAAPASSGIAGLLGMPKLVGLDAQLFEPTKIDATVGGVDVGGLLPRLQRWFVEDKILTLSVSYIDEKTVVVSGDMAVLRSRDHSPFRRRISDATAESIAEEIAYELVRRRLAATSVFFERLQPDEFKTLATSIEQVADINQEVIRGSISEKENYARISTKLTPLADELVSWSELNYFAASVAEASQDYAKALALHQRIRKLPISSELAVQVDKKIVELSARLGNTKTGAEQAALDKISADAKFATDVFNGLFAMNLLTPPVKFPDMPDLKNAYWDGKNIVTPALIVDMPDITYHEAAWPFVQQRWRGFNYQGEQGALAQSFTDILASVAKQRKERETAETADWLIGEGAIAWLTDKLAKEPDAIKTDKRPLRSLKAPGTAYDDTQIGRDLQIAHIRDLRPGDTNIIYTASGIPNKAFYELAKRITTETAAQIWVAGLDKFNSNTTLRTAAKDFYEAAKSKFGPTSEEAGAVKAAWGVVGVKL